MTTGSTARSESAGGAGLFITINLRRRRLRVEFNQDELTLTIESLRAYRLRLPISPPHRRQIVEDLTIKLLAELTKRGDKAA